MARSIASLSAWPDRTMRIVWGWRFLISFGFFSEAMNESLQDFPYPESIRRLKILPTQNPDITVLGAAALVYLGVPSLNN
jgi:hypothetical protein